MSEVKNEKQFVFNFTNRNVKLNKSDFNSKTEQQIFEFFHQNTNDKNSIGQWDFYSSLKLLDFGDNSDKVITEKEISEFLNQMQSQGSVKLGNNKFKTKMLKDVTEEDLIQFFNKVIKLNPTEIESRKKALQSGLKDENGNAVITDEILDNFQNKYDYLSLSDIVDKNNNIKPGYELFDLNGDGKIDNLEKKEWDYGLNLNKLSDIQKRFSETGDIKGVLTTDNKNNLYKQLEENHNSALLDTIKTTSLNDPSSKKDLVTNEVKQLFSINKTVISVDDLVDENGQVKKGLELFDLNNDGKMDELERNYFSNGGKLINKGSNTITLENFVKILKNLDLFDGHNNTTLSNKDKETLYLFTQGAYQMLDTLKEFPEEVKNLYEQALSGIVHVEIDKNKYSAGYQSNGVIGIKDEYNSGNGKPDKFQIASVLIHELTHFICRNLSDKKEYNVMAQEVQTFYMEHKLYEKMKDLPEFKGSKLRPQNEYIYLKKNNPELTELDIAKAVFRANQYDWYNDYYRNSDPNVLENSEYRDIGGIFSEPENKAQIYNAGIQKAFSGLSIKDENGKELITEELKNAFSAEKPILTLKDILENGKIKPGFEIFDFDGDGFLNGNERNYIGLVSYNDIPKLVNTLKQFNANINNDTGNLISTEVRKQFEENVLHNEDIRKKYNFHG